MSALTVGILLIVGALAQGGEEYPNPPTATVAATSTPSPAEVSDVIPTATSQLSVTTNDVVVSSMLEYEQVIDAAITQEGDAIGLVLVVGYATNESYAKELGDRFIRLCKSLSDDEPPGKAIGKGKYDYLIGIYYPNEKQIALGAKSRGADRISW